MLNDYTQITGETTVGGPLGTWWKKPPYAIRTKTYASYEGASYASKKVKADVLSLTRDATEWERFVLEGIDPPIDVVPTGDEGEWYTPNEKPGLLNALLDVAQGSLTPVEFADRFGLLGYDYLVPVPNRCGGDPLKWFLAQARTVLTAADLVERLKEVRENPRAKKILFEYLEKEISDGPYAFGSKVAVCQVKDMWKNITTRSPILAANGILRYLLNPNLGETGRRLQETPRGLRTIFTFHNLLQFIYWQVADQIGTTSIHRCVECGRIFIHSNTRSRFCPPTDGKTISACKSRWNVRSFRKKKNRRRGTK